MKGRFQQIANWIDPEPLLEALRQHPELWDMDTWRQEHQGSPHSQTKSIHLRGPAEHTVEGVFDGLDSVWNEIPTEALPEANDAVAHILTAVDDVNDLGRIMITKVQPGGAISEHIDEGRYADKFDRFHLCLQADEGSIFTCGGDTRQMRPGELWWFNRKLPHSVENRGAVDRIHLVVGIDSPSFKAMRGITFQAEGPSRDIGEMALLLKAHYDEIALYKDIPLEPDFEYYRLLEGAGQLRYYSARDGGKLIGYMLVLVRRHPHYKSSLQGVVDLIYLDPEHRRGRTGMRLIEFAHSRLKAEGVQTLVQHVKDYADFGPVLKHMGYGPYETLWIKRLDL